MSLELLLTVLLIFQMGIIGTVLLFVLPQTIQKSSTMGNRKVLKKISSSVSSSQELNLIPKVA